ncbi:hypothetical protein [Nonomuraea sp. KM88]
MRPDGYVGWAGAEAAELREALPRLAGTPSLHRFEAIERNAL